MGSIETQKWKSRQSSMILIPWDPDSDAHSERLYQQRVACGWNQDKIEEWKVSQREGAINIQWVVLPEDDGERESKLAKHTTQFPSEYERLIDSASSFGGKDRDLPPIQRIFKPVGHIALMPASPDPEIQEPLGSVFTIATFYISRALQSDGLGRAAMDMIESKAVGEPLCAKVLTLNTVSREYIDDLEMRKALNLAVPKVVGQDWYERRGYRMYKHVPNSYPTVDSAGKVWTATAVYMKKKVG